MQKCGSRYRRRRTWLRRRAAAPSGGGGGGPVRARCAAPPPPGAAFVSGERSRAAAAPPRPPGLPPRRSAPPSARGGIRGPPAPPAPGPAAARGLPAGHRYRHGNPPPPLGNGGGMPGATGTRASPAVAARGGGRGFPGSGSRGGWGEGPALPGEVVPQAPAGGSPALALEVPWGGCHLFPQCHPQPPQGVTAPCSPGDGRLGATGREGSPAAGEPLPAPGTAQLATAVGHVALQGRGASPAPQYSKGQKWLWVSWGHPAPLGARPRSRPLPAWPGQLSLSRGSLSHLPSGGCHQLFSAITEAGGRGPHGRPLLLLRTAPGLGSRVPAVPSLCPGAVAAQRARGAEPCRIAGGRWVWVPRAGRDPAAVSSPWAGWQAPLRRHTRRIVLPGPAGRTSSIPARG